MWSLTEDAMMSRGFGQTLQHDLGSYEVFVKRCLDLLLWPLVSHQNLTKKEHRFSIQLPDWTISSFISITRESLVVHSGCRSYDEGIFHCSRSVRGLAEDDDTREHGLDVVDGAESRHPTENRSVERSEYGIERQPLWSPEDGVDLESPDFSPLLVPQLEARTSESSAGLIEHGERSRSRDSIAHFDKIALHRFASHKKVGISQSKSYKSTNSRRAFTLLRFNPVALDSLKREIVLFREE